LDSKEKFLLRASSQWLQPIILLFLAGLSFLLLRPHTVGIWGDDTTYLIVAKALASGQGYHLISWPSTPPFTKYPPLFPLLLSLFWRLESNFPAVVLWAKLLNVTLSLLALNTLYLLARRTFAFPRSLAAMLCLFVGSNATWLAVNLEVMSEPLYTALALGALYIALQGKAFRSQNATFSSKAVPIQPTQQETKQKTNLSTHGKTWVLLVALSVAAFYTRTIAASLILALGVWLWRQQGKRAACLYWGICLLLGLGWLLWNAQSPTPVIQMDHFYVYSYNQSYFREWWLNSIARQGLGPLLANAVQELPKALLTVLLPFPLPWPTAATAAPPGTNSPLIGPVCLSIVFLTSLFAGLCWMARRLEKMFLPVSTIFFYLLALLAWPSQDQYPRLLVCLLPLLALVLFQLFQLQRRRGMILAIALTMLSLASNLAHLQPVEGNRETLAKNMSTELWGDYLATFKAIREKSPADALFWARPDGLLFLNTGRRAMNFQITPAPGYFQKAPVEHLPQLLAITGTQLEKSGARYILLDPYFMGQQPMDAFIVDWIRLHRNRFRKVYTSPHRHLFVYQVL
jgi:hypothetical protein